MAWRRRRTVGGGSSADPAIRSRRPPQRLRDAPHQAAERERPREQQRQPAAHHPVTSAPLGHHPGHHGRVITGGDPCPVQHHAATRYSPARRDLAGRAPTHRRSPRRIEPGGRPCRPREVLALRLCAAGRMRGRSRGRSAGHRSVRSVLGYGTTVNGRAWRGTVVPLRRGSVEGRVPLPSRHTARGRGSPPAGLAPTIRGRVRRYRHSRIRYDLFVALHDPTTGDGTGLAASGATHVGRPTDFHRPNKGSAKGIVGRINADWGRAWRMRRRVTAGDRRDARYVTRGPHRADRPGAGAAGHGAAAALPGRQMGGAARYRSCYWSPSGSPGPYGVGDHRATALPGACRHVWSRVAGDEE